MNEDQQNQEGETIMNLVAAADRRATQRFVDCDLLEPLQKLIDDLIDKQAAEKSAPLAQIPRAYGCTSRNSPIRKLFIDLALKNCRFDDDSWFNEQVFGWYTKEYHYDLALTQREERKGVRSMVMDFKPIARTIMSQFD